MDRCSTCGYRWVSSGWTCPRCGYGSTWGGTSNGDDGSYGSSDGCGCGTMLGGLLALFFGAIALILLLAAMSQRGFWIGAGVVGAVVGVVALVRWARDRNGQT